MGEQELVASGHGSTADQPNLQRFHLDIAPGEGPQGLIEAGRLAARQGDLPEARRLLHAAAEQDANCAEAWLGLAWLAETRQERESHLRRVLALEPGHAKAQVELARLQRSFPPASAEVTKGGRLWIWGPLALATGLVLLALAIFAPLGSLPFGLAHRSLAWLLATPTPSATPTPTMTPREIADQFVPQLEAALTGGDWDRALEIVAIMRGVDPTGSNVQRWALAAHMRYGQALVEERRADQALVQFDQAIALAPADPAALQWQQATKSYLAGLEALQAAEWSTAIQAFTQAQEQVDDYADLLDRLVDAYLGQGQAAINAGDWTAAIESLTKARERKPGDPEVLDLLAEAYRGRGIAYEEAGQLPQARSDLEAALALWPADEETKAHLDAVMYRLFPPKRIEIDISEQRLYAYEGDAQVFKFVVSTGLPGRDTATGNFKVLDKIPMAYSEVWRLKMPNWLGIYYVGPIENGIHALPIRPDGSVMWAGFLGQKASYGCIILNNENAKALYNWAEVGTKVEIRN